jgi:DNA-binding CsgD family transcriptional regulator
MDLKNILTPQEIRLGQCLVEGLSLRKAALSMGITYETARDKLKTMYQKTGTNSQVQLALLIDRSNRSFELNSNAAFNGHKGGSLLNPVAEEK